jgi:hypothetical protein
MSDICLGFGRCNTYPEASVVRTIADANEVSELLIRVYSQSKDETLRSRCVDLVDRMIQMGTYGLDKALQQFER